jgi:hypothetical protein
MKLLIMQFSPSSCRFIPLQSKYPQHPVLKHPQPMFLPYLSETKFHNHTEPQAKLWSCIFQFYVFKQQMRIQNIQDWIIANITRIQSPVNFLLKPILICYCPSQIFDLQNYHKTQCFGNWIFPSSGEVSWRRYRPVFRILDNGQNPETVIWNVIHHCQTHLGSTFDSIYDHNIFQLVCFLEKRVVCLCCDIPMEF